MKTKYKITISGLPGAGKGTLIKKLSEFYNLKEQSIGSMRRDFAINQKLTIDELNNLRKTDPSVDTRFDEFQKEYMGKNSNWIMEGRLSYFFAPQEAIRLFLAVDPIEGARRIYCANRNSEQNYKSEKEALETIKSRTNSDKETYWNLYKTNCYDTTNFDIIIDTTYSLENEIFHQVVQRIENLVLSKF